jgi:signal transduction histidine kinase
VISAKIKEWLANLRRRLPERHSIDVGRMTETLREWLVSLRRLLAGQQTLERSLAMTIGGLVLAAILLLAISAVGLLRKQSEQQALARVELAGISAREEIRRLGEDGLTTTRALATRQPLQRLIRTGNRPQLELFLRRSCTVAGFTHCAVLVGSTVIGSTRADIGWRDALEASADQGERFLLAPAWQPDGLQGAVAVVPNAVDTRLVSLSYFSPRLAKVLSEQTGLQIRLVRLSNWLDNVEPPFKALHSTALSRAEIYAARIDERETYASSTPLFASTGEGIALLEARLPTSTSDAVVAGFIRRLGWTVVLLSLLALGTALLLARRIVRPLQSLAESATKLGRGDFSASIPISGGPETAGLARTLEDMRRHLVELTATLRRREADAQAMLAGVVEGVFAVDANRHVQYLNPQAQRMLGVDAQSAIGRFCGDVLKPSATKEGLRPCETACPIIAARGSGQARATEFLLASDGSKRTVIITSASMVDGRQVQVMRDETELEAVRRARDSILANISHEFRTPLAAQLASIELLQENLHGLSREQLEELVSSLQRGTLRLTRLIDNLLESVRIESGQLGIRQQTLHLTDVVQDAVELVGSLLPQRKQQLQLEVPEDLPAINGDAPRLVQVFVNLLANANKFGPEGSVIRIGAERTDGALRAWVDDEGPGVQDAERGSVFDRFYRAADQEPEPRGLGLGLWIVKSIVERHGGQVAAGRAEDGRTRFAVTLPVDTAAA